MLAGVFNNFRNMCLEMYEFDPANFFSAPGLAWQTALQKTKVKLHLLNDIDMLLMVEKGIRGGICHYMDMKKILTSTWKIMIKIKDRHFFSIEIKIIYMVG